MKDIRTAAQRRHDALLEALKAAQRAQQLPSSAGVTTTVLLTATRTDWEAGRGLVQTGHGALIPVQEARRWAGGDARVMTITADPAGVVTGWSDARGTTTSTSTDQGSLLPCSG